MNNDNLGDRMKRYELSSKTVLLPRGYIVLRVDGKAFHTFTKNANIIKPFDDRIIDAMVTSGIEVSREIQGFKLGYHQSDEFTFLLTDTDTYQSQYWFGGEVQKLCSITASMFSAYFNDYMLDTAIGRTKCCFDCRAFNVPYDDVANVFIWRQKDWYRNSVTMLASKYFTHHELYKKGVSDMHEMLYTKGVNWADIEKIYKNGTFITMDRERLSEQLTYEEVNNLIL